jgi:hypothetical protein
MDETLRAGLADRHQIDSDVGSGAMATFYRARDIKHGRTVAIKVLDLQQGCPGPRGSAEGGAAGTGTPRWIDRLRD